MKVGIFLDSANHKRFRDVLKSFAKGVEKSGDTPFISTGMYEECDVAVIFGSWKDRKDRHHVVKNDIIKKAKKFIVLETPILGRGPVTNIMQDDWYRIGINGFLADTGNFNNKNCDDKRWKKIQKTFDIDILPWNIMLDHNDVLIALQLPGDASLNGQDISAWAVDSYYKMREIRKSRYMLLYPQIEREYSQELIDLPEKTYYNVVKRVSTYEDLSSIILNHHATVTYSSGLGIESILLGIPTIAMSPSSFAYDVSSNSLDDINNPKRFKRQQWLNDLSYCQWSHEEIEDGLPWNHLKEVL